MTSSMHEALYYVIWIAVGILFGSMLFATLVGATFMLRGKSGAATATLILVVSDLILVQLFFAWPLWLGLGLRFLQTDLVFGTGVLLALAVLSGVLWIGFSQPDPQPERRPASLGF